MADHIGFFDSFKKHLRLPMKSVNYTPYEKIKVLISSILTNCSYIKDINHKLKPYPYIRKILNIKGIPDQSTINKFLNRIRIEDLIDLEVIFDDLLERIFLKKRKICLIVDTIGLVVFGEKYQFAKKGYFPKKRGNKGYQVSIGITGENYPKITSVFVDPGNIPLDLRLLDTIYQTGNILGGLNYISLLIGDAIYGTEKNIKDNDRI